MTKGGATRAHIAPPAGDSLVNVTERH